MTTIRFRNSIANGPTGSARINLLLALLLLATLALHVGLASIRQPVGPRYGDDIEGTPGNDTLNPGVLRVASYNIRRGRGLDGERDLDRIARALEGFDIVGLNEVGGAFPPAADQAERLGHALDMGWLYAPSQRRWYIDYFGNALLSRLAPVRWQSLPMVHDLEKGTGHRNVLTVVYDWQGRDFTLMVVHAETGEDIRRRQTHAIFEQFDRHPRAVLMGDFNATREDPLLREAAAKPGIRHANDGVDWIFVRGFRIVDSGSRPAGPSDHPLVWANLEAPED